MLPLPISWRIRKVEPPISGLECPYGVDWRTQMWICFLNPPRGLGRGRFRFGRLPGPSKVAGRSWTSQTGGPIKPPNPKAKIRCRKCLDPNPWPLSRSQKFTKARAAVCRRTPSRRSFGVGCSTRAFDRCMDGDDNNVYHCCHLRYQ